MGSEMCIRDSEYAMVYGLVVGQNVFARRLLENYQDYSKAVGAFCDHQTPVVDPDGPRELVPFNPKPPSSSLRDASGAGSFVVKSSERAGPSSTAAGTSGSSA